MKDKLNMKTKKKIKITNVTPKKTTKPKEPKYYTFEAASWAPENPAYLTARNTKYYNAKIKELFSMYDYMDFIHLELAKRVTMLERQIRLIWKNIEGLKTDVDGIYTPTIQNRKNK